MRCNLCPECSGVLQSTQYTHSPQNQTSCDILIIREQGNASDYKNNSSTGKDIRIILSELDKIGISLESGVVIKNILAIGCKIVKKKGAKPYSKEVLSNCSKKLLQLVFAINPKIIITLGATALKIWQDPLTALKISSEYGVLREVHGYKTFPMLNPQVLLYTPAEYKTLLHQINLFKSSVWDKAEVEVEETKYEILDTVDKIFNALEILKHEKVKWIAMDTETTSLDYREANFLVGGVSYKKGHAWVIPREMKHLFNLFFHNTTWKTIWQNGKYDKRILWANKLGELIIQHDVMYMHYILDETSAHGLEYLSRYYLGVKPYKYKMNQNWKSVNLESYDEYFSALCERVAVDCDNTLQLANKLYMVEQKGMLLDFSYFSELTVQLGDMISITKEQIITKANELGWDVKKYAIETGAKSIPMEFNPNSSQQVGWLLYKVLQIEPLIKTKTKDSTDKKVLESIADKPEIVELILKVRKYVKELSTYVLAPLKLADHHHIIRTNFNLHSTATGRLSSSQPNIQNQSSANAVTNIRKGFIAPPGYILAEIDYAGAELRWAAYLSGCTELTKVFIDNINLHHNTAVKMFGNYNKAQKLRAKAVNFGILYGREAQSFCDEFKISLKEAKKMIQIWLDSYPGVKNYLAWTEMQVKLGNYLETPFGRRRRFGLISSSSICNILNEAKNFPIQSCSSDLTLSSALYMYYYLKNRDVHIVNLVHDSIVMYIPSKADLIRKIAHYCNYIMVQRPIELFDCKVPFKTDFEIGLNWGELIEYSYETKNLIIDDQEVILEEWLQSHNQ